MQRTNIDNANETLIKSAIALCKEMPNDADLGRELRKILTASAEKTFFDVAKNTDKNKSTSN